jgi:hypothetical protein
LCKGYTNTLTSQDVIHHYRKAYGLTKSGTCTVCALFVKVG